MHSQTVLLCCFAVLLVVCTAISAESAFYVPRSFYSIDADGHQSALSVIGARHQNAILHRLKRAAAGIPFAPSSSVNSRVSASNDVPAYVQQAASAVGVRWLQH